jgi:hypothetical protein
MMNEPTVECPKCGTEIKLTETLAAPMVAAVEEKYQAQMRDLSRQVEDDRGALRVEQDELAARHKQLEEEVTKKAEESRVRIRGEEKRRLQFAMEEQQKELDAKDMKLAEAQREQAALMRRQRELEEKERELDLTVEKKIQDGLSDARAKAEQAAEERIGLRVREREETIASMSRQIDDLKRKAEQGSQQLQGEVQELQLEEALKAQFTEDSIEPVPKGVRGGDLIQRVIFSGYDCGTILWESKRTKAWSNTWLPKLREDQREAKADIAVIVSTALPKEMEAEFDIIDGVWLCGPKVAMALAAVMRDGLNRVAAQREINAGMETKAELVYQYLTGSQFKRRVEAIVEAFSTMKEDLDKERRAITKQWTKRETQIGHVMQATVGMYGDLQGIAGQAIHEVEGLELKALEA